MADNVAITAGAGTTISTDDVGGVHYQEIKLIDGTADSTTPVVVDVGAKANALRVAPANDITDGTYIGDIKFGEALPAGTAAIGKLAANSGVDIGDVDVTSIVPGAGATNLGKAEDAAHASGDVGVMALAVRDDAPSAATAAAGDYTPLLTNATGHLYTIDPTNNALITTGNASLVTIAGDTTSIDGKITACNTGAVVLAAGANAIGKLAANSGVDIGDVDVTSCANTSGDIAHDTGDSGNPVKVGGKAVSFDGTVPGTAVAEADRANFITDLYGRQYVETCHPRYFNARADYAGAQTNTTVQAAAGAGLKLFITDIMISNGATAGNITLLDGSGGTVIWEIYTAINGGCVANFRTPIVLTANTLLAITSTTVTTHSVAVQGYIAP